jgi:hypothetical protein
MQGIYPYIPETNNVPKQYNVAAILSLLFMVPISLAAALALMYFYISTFLSMCAVPNIAVFCSSLTSWLPDMVLTYFLMMMMMMMMIIIIIIIQYAKLTLRSKPQCWIFRFTSFKLSHFSFELNTSNIIKNSFLCHAKRAAFLLQRSAGEIILGKYSVCCDNQSIDTGCTVWTNCRVHETYSRWYKLLPLYSKCLRNSSNNSYS